MESNSDLMMLNLNTYIDPIDKPMNKLFSPNIEPIPNRKDHHSVAFLNNQSTFSQIKGHSDNHLLEQKLGHQQKYLVQNRMNNAGIENISIKRKKDLIIGKDEVDTATTTSRPSLNLNCYI